MIRLIIAWSERIDKIIFIVRKILYNNFSRLIKITMGVGIIQVLV